MVLVSIECVDYDLPRIRNRKMSSFSNCSEVTSLFFISDNGGCHAPIAQQGEHARVEIVKRDSVTTSMLALLRDANMAPQIQYSGSYFEVNPKLLKE